MSTEENKAIARRWIEGINHKNLAVWDEVCAADCIFHDPPPREITLEEYKAVFAEGGWLTAFPDWHLTIDDEIAEGDTVVIRFTGRGTHKHRLGDIAPTGKQVTGTAIAIYRIADGKIAEAWANFDYLGIFQQLGMIPPQGESEG